MAHLHARLARLRSGLMNITRTVVLEDCHAGFYPGLVNEGCCLHFSCAHHPHHRHSLPPPNNRSPFLGSVCGLGTLGRQIQACKCWGYAGGAGASQRGQKRVSTAVVQHGPERSGQRTRARLANWPDPQLYARCEWKEAARSLIQGWGWHWNIVATC